ncbi:unnamed protein product [Psylliodes chrysocephalus]|uniref:Uncharacterized protein n=1 Tax=Psylliodes chrysocephalus TaxID=3402493 RepID=A0A9P0CIW2_9CUCU|nr:unnamed protein product [Psylliodes chrysocephala]
MTNQFKVQITAHYIPGVCNSIPDCLYRKKELPDWHLSSRVTHDFPKVGSTRGGSICNKCIGSSSSICDSVDTRYKRVICICLQQKLGLSVGLGVSTTNINSESPTTSKQGKRNIYNNCPELGTSILETRLTSPSDSLTNTDSRSSEQLNMQSRRPLPEAHMLSLEAWKVRGGTIT